MRPGSAPEGDDNSIATSLQEAIADEAKSQVAEVLEIVPDIMKEAVNLLFRAATLSAQERVCTVVYHAVEHVFLDQIRTAVLGETINKPPDQYFKAGKPLATG